MPEQVWAMCYDGHSLGVEQEFADSTAVVVAKIIQMQDVQEDQSDPAGITATIYTAHVMTWLKGKGSREIRIRSPNTSARFPMDLQAVYLLFLSTDAHGYFVDSCGNSLPATESIGTISVMARKRLLAANTKSGTLTSSVKACNNVNPWACYGTFDVQFSMLNVEQKPEIFLPLSSLLVLYFPNGEIMATRQQFEFGGTNNDAPEAESYLQLTGLQLFKNRSMYKNVIKEVEGDIQSILEILQKAYPGGSDSLHLGHNEVVVEIISYGYPSALVQDKIHVKLYKASDGSIDIEYQTVGEPVGPYLVQAHWLKGLSPELSNDFSLQGWASEQAKSFRTLGEARLQVQVP